MQNFSDLIHFKEKNFQAASATWANFLFELGKKAALPEMEKSRILLVLPTVDLAVPLIALGYIYTKFRGDDSDNLSLDFFKKLPVGSSLIYRSDQGPQKAVFEGVVPFRDTAGCVSVRIQSRKKGAGKHLLLPHQLKKVSVVSHSKDKSPSEREIGKSVAGISDFAKFIYGPENIGDLSPILNSVWLVGQYSETENELTNTALEASSNARMHGTFNDLLRVDQFLKPKDPPFTCFVSSYRHDPEFRISPDNAKFVIFREAASYLKHNHRYNNATQILLTDFADRGLDEVIGAYNQGFYRRSDDLQINIDNPPANIIFAGYRGAA